MALAITIDGPAGAGKSTTARRMSKKSGFNYVDTGLFYRSIGAGIRMEIGKHPREVAETDIVAWAQENYSRIGQLGTVALLDGENITALCRDVESGAAASAVAKIQEVRDITDAWTVATVGSDQNTYAITEGRDEARLHTSVGQFACGFYLTASSELRAYRRYTELVSQENATEHPEIQDILLAILKRDMQDMTRDVSPLSPVFSDHFRFVAVEDDLPVPTTGWQLGIESGAFQGREEKQDNLMLAGIDRIVA